VSFLGVGPPVIPSDGGLTPYRGTEFVVVEVSKQDVIGLPETIFTSYGFYLLQNISPSKAQTLLKKDEMG